MFPPFGYPKEPAPLIEKVDFPPQNFDSAIH